MARILIVDDSIVMRRNLEFILKSAGHTVVGQASNGRQAIIMYSELNPDLVTMDISMPIMNGVDTVVHIMKLHKNAKIIMISALNQKQMVFEAIKNGALHYITKPINQEALLQVINEVLADNTDKTNRVLQTSKTNPGFAISNANGKFMVTFNKNFGLKDLDPLETAVKGLLYVNPLCVIFDFGYFDNIDSKLMHSIVQLANLVKDSGGVLEYHTNSETLKKTLL